MRYERIFALTALAITQKHRTILDIEKAIRTVVVVQGVQLICANAIMEMQADDGVREN